MPTDICSYKSVQYSYGISSSFTCQYNRSNHQWFILQTIFNNTNCRKSEIANQIKYECTSATCHCSHTSSGSDCRHLAILRSEDFDFHHLECNALSFTESIIVTNECMHNDGMYECVESNLIFKSCNTSQTENLMERPSLLGQSSDSNKYSDCTSVQCSDSNTNALSVYPKTACLPTNVCQNEYDQLHGNSSWQYICNEIGTKLRAYYHSHDCMPNNLKNIFDSQLFEHQKDIIRCTDECRKYLNIKAYDVGDDETECDELKKDNLSWSEDILPMGCHSFWYDEHNKHSVYITCTHSSFTVTKYIADDCNGEHYAKYTVNDGCEMLEITVYDETFSYLSLVDIQECHMMNVGKACALNSAYCIMRLMLLIIIISL